MGRGHQEYSQDLQNMWNGSKKLCRKQYSSSKNHREMKKVFIRLPYMRKKKNYQLDYFRFVSLLKLIQPTPAERSVGL